MNLAALDDAGMGFIVGSRSVKAPIDLASHFHWNGDAFTNGQIIDTVTPRHANSIVNDLAHRAEQVWNPDDHPGAWRAIWAYSAKRARRDQKTPMPKKPATARSSTATVRLIPPGSSKPTAGDRILDKAGLARALRSTNAIESMISVCRDHAGNVKRWRNGQMALRWCIATRRVATFATSAW